MRPKSKWQAPASPSCQPGALRIDSGINRTNPFGGIRRRHAQARFSYSLPAVIDPIRDQPLFVVPEADRLNRNELLLFNIQQCLQIFYDPGQ